MTLSNVELSVKEIVQAVAPTDNQIELVEIDDQGDLPATIHVTKALESLEILQNYFVQEGIEDPKDFDKFRMILIKKCFDAKKQTSVKDFFKPINYVVQESLFFLFHL